MHFDFQLSEKFLKDIIQTNIAYELRDKCFLNTITYQGEAHWVERVEVTGSTSIKETTTFRRVHISGDDFPNDTAGLYGKQLEIVQQVKIHLVKIDDLKAYNDAPTPPTISLALGIVFILDVNTKERVVQPAADQMPTIELDAEFCMAFQEIDFTLADSLLSTEQKETINLAVQQSIPSRLCKVIDLIALNKLLKSDTPVRVTNAGLRSTILDNGEIMAQIRIGTNDLVNALNNWSSFFHASLSNQLADRDFAMIIPQELIAATILTKTLNGLVNSSSSFALVSGPSVSWNHPAGAEFKVSFSGEAIDACICGFEEIDVGVDVDFRITQTAEQRSDGTWIIMVRTFIETDLNDADVLCCALTATQFFPIVGAIYLDKEKIGPGEYLGSLASYPAAVFVAFLVFASDIDATDYLPNEEDCFKESDELILCPSSATTRFIGNTTLTVQRIDALPQGPVYKGMANFSKITDPEIFSLINPFSSWRPLGVCDDPFIGTYATINLKSSPASYGIKICDIQVSDDPANQYTPFLHLSSGDYISNTITLNPLYGKHPAQPKFKINYQEVNLAILLKPDDLKPAFTENPYPLILTLRTSRGNKIITIQPPSIPTGEEIESLEKFIDNMLGNCLTFSHLFWGKIFNPYWTIDPPPYKIETIRIYNLLVKGLDSADQLSVIDQQQTRLAAFSPSLAGSVSVSFQMSGELAQKELGFDMNTSVPPPALQLASRSTTKRKNTSAISFKQVSLIKNFDLPIPTIIESFGKGYYQGKGVFYSCYRGALVVYAASISRPQIVARVNNEHLTGGCIWLSNIVWWTEYAIHLDHQIANQRAKTIHLPKEETIVNVLVAGHYLVMLTNQGIYLINRDMQIVDRIGQTGATSVIRSGKSIIVATKNKSRKSNKLSLYKISAEEKLILESEVNTTAFSRLHAYPSHAIKRSFLIEKNEESLVAFEWKRGENELHKIASFTSRPWETRNVRIKQVYLVVSPDNKAAAVYSLYKTWEPNGINMVRHID